MTDQEIYEMAHARWYYEDGVLYSKRTKKIIGAIATNGYMSISTTINNGPHCQFRVHRIIFLMHHGYLPDVVDHINRDILDNRIENLRAATVHENSFNRSTSPRNKLGVKGVVYESRFKLKPYVAYIKLPSGKRTRLGQWATLEEAAAAYNKAAQQLHGTFAPLT